MELDDFLSKLSLNRDPDLCIQRILEFAQNVAQIVANYFHTKISYQERMYSPYILSEILLNLGIQNNTSICDITIDTSNIVYSHMYVNILFGQYEKQTVDVIEKIMLLSGTYKNGTLYEIIFDESMDEADYQKDISGYSDLLDEVLEAQQSQLWDSSIFPPHIQAATFELFPYIESLYKEHNIQEYNITMQ
jgi:hypothetical protein